MNRSVPLVILCLCLSCASVRANDLITKFLVVDCNGRAVQNATVRISGCVDNPIYAKTNSSGIAETTYGSSTCIQYCYHIADSPCLFEVVSAATTGTYSAQTLTLPDGTTNATAKQYICDAVNCCHPCGQNMGDPEETCTGSITVDKTIEFAPTSASCPVTPVFDVSHDTCFAFITSATGTVYTGVGDLSTLGVVSVSLRDNQQNDDVNKITLTSGLKALNNKPTVPPFAKLSKNNRWGWEQLFNKPSGLFTTTGIMYCGQNKPGGHITVNFDGQTLTYSINMPGTPFSAGDVHVFADCNSWPDKAVAPGQFNCNPSKPSAVCGFKQLSSSPTVYSASMNVSLIAANSASCVGDGSKVFTMFHLGL